MQKKVLALILVGTMVFLLTGTFGWASQKSKSVQIKFVTFSPSKSHYFMIMDLIKKLEEKSKGRLTFKNLGGREVVPTFEQIDATRKGVVDMCISPSQYAAGMVPEVVTSSYTDLGSRERRKSGFYDVLKGLYEKQNLAYMGLVKSVHWSEGFGIFSNVKIDKPEDLKGLKIRTSAAYRPMLANFGAIAVTMKGADIYTAMERGVVKGFIFPLPSAAPFAYSLPEVTKYFVRPGFGHEDVSWYLNLRKWKGIPSDLQKLIIKTTAEVEKEWEPKWQAIFGKALGRFKKAGMKEIVLSPKAGQRLVSAYYNSGWSAIIDKSPVNGAKLRKLAGLPPLQR